MIANCGCVIDCQGVDGLDGDDEHCWYCAGEACATCLLPGSPPDPACDHDMMGRHLCKEHVA